MATVNKDFKIKNGLIVEGTTGTINGNDILTKAQADQEYIQDLVGGSGDSNATANTLVLRDSNASFSANVITADIVGDVTGTVSDISNHDTDDLSEGTTNKYFANSLARQALSGGTGITYDNNTGEITVTANTYDAYGSASNAQAAAENYADGLAVNYDPTGSAANAQSAAESTASGYVSTHSGLTTGVHGVTGDVVGTSDSQTLTNKTIGDSLTFNDGSNNSTIDVSGNDLSITANVDLTLSAANGDILLNPDGHTYIGSATAGNEVATHSYVDNAVSGLNWKQAVNLLAASNIALSGSDGTLVIDSHPALTAADNGYRLLLTGQSTGSQNGIYVYNASAGSYTLSRSADADAYTELIGAAVYVMEGTQYGSTSWVQGDHYLTDFSGQDWTQFSGQGSVTAGTGITVDGLEVSVDRSIVDTWYDPAGSAANAQSAAESYADGLASNYDPAGSAATAYSNATSYADGLASNYDPAGSASNAYSNATSYTDTAINNLDTDDIEEGVTNQYFTDGRAKDSAADLLTNATLTNITITGTGAGLTISAENGVADSTTDDLDEGNTNLYFTDQRAIDAVANADITPNTVTIDTYRKEEATQQYVATASTVTVHSLPSGFESAKYLVRVVGSVSGTQHSQLTEILITTDGNNNIAITEYGTICTHTSNLASFSATYSGGVYSLTGTTLVNGCEIIAAATMLSWAD